MHSYLVNNQSTQLNAETKNQASHRIYSLILCAEPSVHFIKVATDKNARNVSPKNTAKVISVYS